MNHSDSFKQFVIKNKPEVLYVLHGWMDHDAWLMLAIESCRYDAWHIRHLPDYLWSDKDFIIKIVSPGGQCVYESKAMCGSARCAEPSAGYGVHDAMFGDQP